MSDSLRRLLLRYRGGRLATRDLLEVLREMPYRDLSFAKVDLHRQLRRGFPEVVYAKGKKPQEILAIMQALQQAGHRVLVTKVASSVGRRMTQACPRLRYFPRARILSDASPNGGGRRKGAGAGAVLVLTAGTSDIDVAEEAAVTAQLMGQGTSRLYDVGVAGLHRVLKNLKILRRARVIVVVAGMDGVLPSVVSGLVRVPVVAVPTSTGYGASFRGVGPLLTMLNSCSPGVAVVNIDNGFGAGYLAARIAAG